MGVLIIVLSVIELCKATRSQQTHAVQRRQYRSKTRIGAVAATGAARVAGTVCQYCQ